MHPPSGILNLLERLLDAGNKERRQNSRLCRMSSIGDRSHALGLAHLNKSTAQLAGLEHVHCVGALHGTRQRRAGSRVGRLPAEHRGVERDNTGNVVAGDFQPAELADSGKRVLEGADNRQL